MWTIKKQKEIVTVAREYLDTPFHHQGRVKGVGVDCIGLLVGVAKDLGWKIHDCPAYSCRPDGITVVKELSQGLDKITASEATIGDILLFWISKKTRHPQHVAIKTDIGMIHTYAGAERVIEHNLNDYWISRIHSCWRYRNV